LELRQRRKPVHAPLVSVNNPLPGSGALNSVTESAAKSNGIVSWVYHGEPTHSSILRLDRPGTEERSRAVRA